MKRAFIHDDDRSLSVNLDHIVTFRKLRRTVYPDLVHAAGVCEVAGADGITLHLRGDRRHVEESDLESFTRQKTLLPLTLEMAPEEDLISVVQHIRPSAVTLVPERPEELTTEGGLDVVSHSNSLKHYIQRLREYVQGVTLFVEPSLRQLEEAIVVGADSVELHTGRYAILWQEGNAGLLRQEFDSIQEAVLKGRELGLRVNAGHGLYYQNVAPLAALQGLGEFSIGHGILARSFFTGLEEAVREMVQILQG